MLPDDLLWVEDPHTKQRERVVPGELRTKDVQVGDHVAISPGAVPRFFERFAQVYGATGKTFAIYAGAVICFGGLIFTGIRMLSGRFQDAIPELFGALFGAGVLGWGAGWIGTLRLLRSGSLEVDLGACLRLHLALCH